MKTYDKIILFGKSLGGVIGELAIRRFGVSATKLVYSATPHSRDTVKGIGKTKLVNIFSLDDNYLSLANIFLYFGLGKKYLTNAENVVVDNVRHSQFNHNISISYQGGKMKLFDLYKSMVLMKS